MSDFECFLCIPRTTGIHGGFHFFPIEIQIAPRGTKRGEKFAVEVK